MNEITVKLNLDDLTLIQLVKLGDILVTVDPVLLDIVKSYIENVFVRELRKLTPKQYDTLYQLLKSDTLF